MDCDFSAASAVGIVYPTTKKKKNKMSYKKPQIVAKSAAKQSFVASCPEKTLVSMNCSSSNTRCMCGPLK